MFFKVVRRYERGVKKENEALEWEVPEIGDLQVATESVDSLTRQSTVATLRRCGIDQGVFPPLYDANLCSMVGTELIFAGLEQEGDQFFVQEWYCREIED